MKRIKPADFVVGKWYLIYCISNRNTWYEIQFLNISSLCANGYGNMEWYMFKRDDYTIKRYESRPVSFIKYIEEYDGRKLFELTDFEVMEHIVLNNL